MSGSQGFATDDVDVQENNDGNFINLYMFQTGGTWWIRADLRSHNDDENWYIDVMFIRKEIGYSSGNWGWNDL